MIYNIGFSTCKPSVVKEGNKGIVCQTINLSAKSQVEVNKYTCACCMVKPHTAQRDNIMCVAEDRPIHEHLRPSQPRGGSLRWIPLRTLPGDRIVLAVSILLCPEHTSVTGVSSYDV